MNSPGADLRQLIATDPPVMAPLCLEALVGRLIEQTGFKAAYVGGGALGFSMAISEALLTVNDLAAVTRQIGLRVGIPLIVDGTVGFGDAIHAVRAVWELESAGAAAVEFGDQVAPKRAHHHKGIDHLVEPDVFGGKIEAAVNARRDPAFMIIARTGAAELEDLESAIARGHTYVDAGADALLLADVPKSEWTTIRREFQVPLVLMGRHTRAESIEMGASLVLDPTTSQLVALRSIKEALEAAWRGDAPEDLTAIRSERPRIIGLPELYEIESRTTEKDLYSHADPDSEDSGSQ